MSTPTWVEIVCRKCSRHLAGQFVRTSHFPKRAMLAEARDDGAVIRHSEVFCSRACLHLFEQQDLKGPQP